MKKLSPIPPGRSAPSDEDGNIVDTHEERYRLPEYVEGEEEVEEPEDSGEEELEEPEDSGEEGEE